MLAPRTQLLAQLPPARGSYVTRNLFVSLLRLSTVPHDSLFLQHFTSPFLGCAPQDRCNVARPDAIAWQAASSAHFSVGAACSGRAEHGLRSRCSCQGRRDVTRSVAACTAQAFLRRHRFGHCGA